jgi:hypothetical protein
VYGNDSSIITRKWKLGQNSNNNGVMT